MATGNNHYLEGLEKMSKTIQEEKLITQECERKAFVLGRVKKKGWNGCAPYELPLKTGSAGLVSMEECLPTSVFKGSYDKGIVQEQGEIHGSLCVDEKHLRCYKSINKESYIDLIGDDLGAISRRMTHNVDRMLLLDGTVAEVTSNRTIIGGAPVGTLPSGDSVVPGSLFVKCPKEFERGQKYEVSSVSLTTPLTVYVTAVNAQDSYIVFQTNPLDGTAAVPAVMAPYDSLTEEVYIRPAGDKFQQDCGMAFNSLASNLFQGDWYGVNRDASPLLRGDRYDISTATATNVTKKLLDVFYQRAEECSQETMEVLVPYGLFGVLSKELENSKERTDKDKGARIGFRSVTFCLPEGDGDVKVTAVPKMKANTAWILDWDSWMWLGDTSTRDPEAPGSQPSWYRERNCGYLYWKDIYFRGKLVCRKPCDNAKIDLGDQYLICP